ncbi:MAG: Uma2 family endonuclease [Planctomycetes bacterium]|nr:Uma2 family endonuclease [Planctomycetota bacterium]
MNTSFSLDHYEHMVAVGAFSGPFEKRVELVRGEILTMIPIGPPHYNALALLTDWSYEVVPLAKIFVGVQGPIRIPLSNSEPQPDLVWTVRRDYSQRHPEPQEVLLLVEVADSSLAMDRGAKLSVYAEAGIADYWIVNLLDKQIEVHRNPVGRGYQDKSIFRGDTPLHPLALPTASLQASRIFG